MEGNAARQRRIQLAGKFTDLDAHVDALRGGKPAKAREWNVDAQPEPVDRAGEAHPVFVVLPLMVSFLPFPVTLRVSSRIAPYVSRTGARYGFLFCGGGLSFSLIEHPRSCGIDVAQPQVEAHRAQVHPRGRRMRATLHGPHLTAIEEARSLVARVEAPAAGRADSVESGMSRSVPLV